MPRKGISLRAFARQMGVTVRAVQDAIARQRITLNKDGKVDPVRCAREWAENTLHQKRHRKKDEEPGAREKLEGGPPAGSEEGEAPPGPGTGTVTSGLNKARMNRETIAARLMELDYKKKSGELVPAREMRRAAFETARRARDTILAWPKQIGPLLVGRSQTEIILQLDEEVGKLCDLLVRYGKLPAGDGTEAANDDSAIP